MCTGNVTDGESQVFRFHNFTHFDNTSSLTFVLLLSFGWSMYYFRSVQKYNFQISELYGYVFSLISYKIRKRNVIHTSATSANKTLIELVNMP